MARKDVNLVIKARDEAGRVIDQISAALKEFTDAQKNVDTQADKTSSRLGELGAAFAKINGVVGSLDISGKLTNDLQSAAKVLGRVEAEVQKTTTEFAGLEKQLARQTAITERYEAKLKGAREAQEKQRAAIAASKADQAALAKASATAAAAQSKLAKEQARLPASIEKVNAAVDKSRARFEQLEAQILGTAQPTKTLQKEFDAAARGLADNESRLAKLQSRYDQVTSELRAAGSAATIFAGQLDRANKTVARQDAALARIVKNAEGLKIASTESASAQTNLARVSGDVTRRLGRQTDQLQQARQAYTEMAAAAQKAGAQTGQVSAVGVGAIQAELQGQRRAVLETKREWINYQAEIKKAAEAIGRAGVPTAEMARDLELLKVAAKESKGEYIAASQALELMGREFREAGTDIEKLAQAQRNIIGIQERLAKTQNAAAAAAQKQRAAINGTFEGYERGAAASQRLASATQRTNAANNQAATSTRRLASAWREFYGGSRQSLSILQRIRGEVLSLAAAYGGLFAAIQGLQNAIGAIQTVEAATARLSVATGSAEGANRELDYLRRTADRLGIQFGLLAEEYSKFAIATQSSNITANETRKIFTGIAEAARVNRASTSQLSGVFTALTQIVSKGAVQQEELRQQLGDRLPGALQIMADSLGITTAELVKMTEQGLLTERALIPFAQELQDRFGPGLDEALTSLTASLGRFSNAAFKAFAQFANAGFADAFQDLIDSMIDAMESADFSAFIQSLSSAVSTLIGVIQFATDNWRVFFAALSGLAALKLTPIFVAMAGGLVDIAVGARAAAASIATTGTAAAGATGSFTAMAGAAGRLGGALAFLTKGNVIGLAFTAIAATLALWSTNADEATEALARHRDMVDEVKNAYEAADGEVQKTLDSIKSFTATEAEQSLVDLESALSDAIRKLVEIKNLEGATYLNTFFGGPLIKQISGELRNGLDDIFNQLRKGQIPIKELAGEFDKLFQAVGDSSPASKRLGDQLIKQARVVAELAGETADARDIIALFTGTVEEQEEALKRLNGVVEDTNDAFDYDKMDKYASAMSELTEIIDELVPKAEELETALQIEGAFEEAIKNAQTLEERVNAVLAQTEALDALAQATVDGAYGDMTDANKIAAAFLRDEEGFIPTPRFDVNALRVGYGSDTITKLGPNGEYIVEKVVEGMRVSREDANRDLVRRLEQEFIPRLIGQIGQDNFNALSPQQQAALTSITYNSGSLPKGIVAAIKNGGTTEQIAAAIVADIARVQSLPKLSAQEKKVVSERRRREAALFSSTANSDALISESEKSDEQIRKDAQKAAEQKAKDAEKQAELEQKARDSIKEGIEDEQFRQSLEKENLVDREVALALREAEKTAAAAGIELTEKERQQITEVTRAKYAKQAADEADAAVLERATEAQRQVNLLEQEQVAIREQLKAATAEGDTEKVEELKARLEELNGELETARAKAIEMWGAVGGQEANTAIAQINAGAIATEKMSGYTKKMTVDWSQFADLFVNGLTSAFDNFAQAVANGENAFVAARTAFLQFAADFLRQIATMILKAALFRALNGVLGGSSLGTTLGIGVGHTGGLVGSKRIGSGNATRYLSPAMFASARRFHDGGVPGLKPGEVPAVLKTNEEVLTRDDPRHILNQTDSAQGSGKRGLKIVNALSGSLALQEALATPEGEEVLVNYLRANKDVVKASLDG